MLKRSMTTIGMNWVEAAARHMATHHVASQLLIGTTAGTAYRRGRAIQCCASNGWHRLVVLCGAVEEAKARGGRRETAIAWKGPRMRGRALAWPPERASGVRGRIAGSL